MSESNIKSEIRKNERMLNSIGKETILVLHHMFRPDLSISNVLSDKVARVTQYNESINSGDPGDKDPLDLLQEGLSIVANARFRLRNDGHYAIVTGNSDNAVYYNYFRSGTEFHDLWHQYFIEGFYENSALSLGSTDIDWDSGNIEDLCRRWSYIKGLEYSNLHPEIKSTEKITNDQRKDFDAVVRLLSLDAFEEWLNVYIDAIIQSEKALLNIGSAELKSLGRADLKSLFNEDVNIATPFLSLASSRWSDSWVSIYTNMPTYDFSDLITRSNVETLYDSYNQKYSRPSSSLNLAQKFFGMGTTSDKYGYTRHFLNILSICDESDINNRKVGYGLEYAISMLEQFYGDNEYNIARNRKLFLERVTHWSTKSFADVFKKEFYTITSPMIMKGLADSNVYAPLWSAFCLRTTAPTFSSDGIVETNNYYNWTTAAAYDMVLHNVEDRTSVIRVDNNVNDWNLNSVSDWFVISWLLNPNAINSNGNIPKYRIGFVRTIGGEFGNVLCINGNGGLNTDAEAYMHALYINNNTDKAATMVGYPTIVNITNTGIYTAGGELYPLLGDASPLSHSELIIHNAYSRETVRNIILLGLSTNKAEVKASIPMSPEDNDNENDGDDSS